MKLNWDIALLWTIVLREALNFLFTSSYYFLYNYACKVLKLS